MRLSSSSRDWQLTLRSLLLRGIHVLSGRRSKNRLVFVPCSRMFVGGIPSTSTIFIIWSNWEKSSVDNHSGVTPDPAQGLPRSCHWTMALLYASRPECSRDSTYQWPCRREYRVRLRVNDRNDFECIGRARRNRNRNERAIDGSITYPLTNLARTTEIDDFDRWSFRIDQKNIFRFQIYAVDQCLARRWRFLVTYRSEGQSGQVERGTEERIEVAMRTFVLNSMIHHESWCFVIDHRDCRITIRRQDTNDFERWNVVSIWLKSEGRIESRLEQISAHLPT